MRGGKRIHDPHLLDQLEGMGSAGFEGPVWRVSWQGRDPTVGSSTGGRWSSPGEFDVLYTSLARDGALQEIYYHLSKAPVFSDSSMEVSELKVRLNAVVDIAASDKLAAFGIDMRHIEGQDPRRTREIGAAAQFLELDAMIVPSARYAGNNLIIFTERILEGQNISVVATRDINWPAWREGQR